MTGLNDQVPYHLITCPSCGSLESRDRDSCSKCGSTFVLTHSTSYRFSDTHPLVQRTVEVVLGLGFVVIGPLLIFLPFYPGFGDFFGIFFLGIILTVIGFPFGLSLLIFGDLPSRHGGLCQNIWLLEHFGDLTSHPR
jgi:hypothetical protein